MPLRLTLLGVSHPHAPGMVRQVLAHPDEFTLIAVQDGRLEAWSSRVDGWQAASPQTTFTADLDAALSAAVDAVVVEGAVDENVALAQAAVGHGLPVLLEKPAGPRMADFQSLMEAAARTRVHVQLTYLFRYMAAIRAMFRLAEDGFFGQIYEFRARMPKDLTLYDEHEADFARFGGGMFFEMGGHLIDFAVRLLGPPERVHGVMRHDAPQRLGTFIDNGVAVLEHERAVSILEVTALESVPDARRFEVYGTEGAMVIPHLGSGHLANDATQDYLTWRQGDDQWQQHAPPAAVLQIGDLREFAAVVRREKQPEFSAEHDLCVQRTLLEACGMNR